MTPEGRKAKGAGQGQHRPEEVARYYAARAKGRSSDRLGTSPSPGVGVSEEVALIWT